MSNELPERRKSKRLAGESEEDEGPGAAGRTRMLKSRAATFDEQDGDFHFTRGSKSKRVKNAQPEPELEPEPETAPLPVKKSGRGRPTKARTSTTAPAPTPAKEPPVKKTAASSKPNTRRTAGLDVVEEDEPQLGAPAPKRTTRRSTRNSTHSTEQEQDKPIPKRSFKPASRPAPVREEAHDDAEGSEPMEIERQSTPRALNDSVESAKIALPISDTPVINRNKEMRKKGGGNRRSSTGMRGRRASSLIESGHNAIPHREVDTAEFYKHIESEGLMEPRRMKQLLTWCGERALSEKPPHGKTGSNAVLGGESGAMARELRANADFSQPGISKSSC